MPEEMFNRDPKQRIGKQIVLPLSRAIEISYKSLRTRFWRSSITVASIVLAIAFLSFIFVNTTIVRALTVRPAEAVKRLELRRGQLQEMIGLRNDPSNTAKLRELEESLGVKAGEAQAELDGLTARLVDERKLRDVLKMKLAAEGGEGAGEETAAEQGEPRSFLWALKAKDYWLVSLASLVCFVGIVNAMLMSVTERFREIGTMKCLGALDSFIVKLFFLESAFLGFVGTLIGVVVGGLLAVAVAMRYGGATVRFFPWGGVLACLVFSQAVGMLLTIVASVFPAHRAARMQPVEALRAEQ